MSVTEKPWSGDPARFSDQEYARSTILDKGDCSAAMRDATPKERYSLPIREPSGDLNVNALGAAAAALSGARGGVQACPEAKAKAARRLLRAYGEAQIDPPESLKRRAQ